jgi:galactokinase/mevalonate kinase-like predicted kinase
VLAVAAAHGATGGKGTGAGGGGCVLLACARGTRDAVAGALHEAGFGTIPFRITRLGVHVVTERPPGQE